mmetsp:Transcript_4451/g.10428  ORF Transcript_4451/g.10428 Transcript_4451/m.10428 type:complete len:225 (-) Transcript_4451:603-1277(-)
MQRWLAQQERVGSEHGQVDSHELGCAVQAAGLVHLVEAGIARQELCRQRQPPHVVLWEHRQVVAPELDLHNWSVDTAAVCGFAVWSCRLDKQVRESVDVRWGQPQVRSARVQDGGAIPAVAYIQPSLINIDAEHIHHPVAKLGLGERHPGQRLEQMLWVMATKCNLALILVVALGQEDAKARESRPLPLQASKEAEVAGDCQVLEAEAKDRIKGEVLKGVVGHV